MSTSAYRVGRLTLVPFRELTDGEALVPIGRKALEVLSVLAEADGALVTKDELMAAVWPNVIVEENALQAHIAALRKVLGSEAGLLNTAHGLGYRLVATPDALPTGERADAPGSAAPARDSWQSPAMLPGAAGLAIVLAIVGLLYLGRPAQGRITGLPTIAVLGFQPTVGGAGAKALADPLAGAVADALSHYNLTIVTTAPAVASSPDQQAQLRASAGADFVVDGRVVEANQKLHVTTELWDARNNVLVYSFDTAQPQDAKADLAGEIANHVALSLDPTKLSSKLGNKLSATDYTIIARDNDAIDRWDPPDILDQGRKLSQRYPNDGDLQAAVAIGAISAVPSAPANQKPQLMLLAHQSIQRAGQLFPDSAIGYNAREMLVNGPLGFPEQERLLREALRSDPSFHVTYNGLGEVMMSVGRTDEAVGLIKRSVQLDPMSGIVTFAAGGEYVMAGRRDEASHILEREEEIWPDHPVTLQMKYMIAIDLGTPQEVEALNNVYHPARNTGPIKQSHLDLMLSAWRTKDPKSERAVFKNCLGDEGKEMNIDLACFLEMVNLGALDQAFRLSELIYPDYRNLYPMTSDDWLLKQPRTLDTAWLFMPRLKPFRDDPRFWGVALRTGLVNYWQTTGSWPDFCQPRLDQCKRLGAAAASRGHGTAIGRDPVQGVS